MSSSSSSSGSSANGKMITLKSSDGVSFQVVESVAVLSKTLKFMIEDKCADTTIPLFNIDSKILSKVIDYCKRHIDSPANSITNEDLQLFDQQFLKVDQDTLFDLIMAANFLDIKSLLDLTCKRVADMMKECSTPEQIRKKFNIENDYSPEEEAAVRREHNWAFQ